METLVRVSRGCEEETRERREEGREEGRRVSSLTDEQQGRTQPWKWLRVRRVWSQLRRCHWRSPRESQPLARWWRSCLSSAAPQTAG
jgi:hypothetical protein